MSQEIPNKFYIFLKHGLANRLRTIIGFLYVAEKKNKQVIFHWDIKDIACNGRFFDLFQQIDSPNAKLIECEKQKNIDYLFIGEDVISNIIKKYASEDIPPNLSKDHLWGSAYICQIESKYYPKLIIQPDIIDKVAVYCTYIGSPFYAMHIRRTDHVQLAKDHNSYTSFDEFEQFMMENNDLPIYLATDERKVQLKYPNTLTYKKISEESSKNLRQTPLKDAFIEVLICANAKKFKGSGFSSFSGLIQIYRKILARI